MEQSALTPAPANSANAKLGLALGSGAARGLAHIGVIRALQERAVQIDYVAGTSIGAIIGAVYCAGNIERLARDFISFDWKRIATLLDPVFPRSGLIDGHKVADFVRAYVSARNVEDLPVPFCAVATDMLTGEEVVISKGDLIEAIRASIAVPGVLTPLRRDGRLLVDGGLVNPVPARTVRVMGAGRVIAVDLNGDLIQGRLAHLQYAAEPRTVGRGTSRLLDALRALHSPAAEQLNAWLRKEPMPGILDVLLGSLAIMQAQIARTSLVRDRPDLVVRPALGTVRFMEFDRAAEIIAIGHETAAAALDQWAH